MKTGMLPWRLQQPKNRAQVVLEKTTKKIIAMMIKLSLFKVLIIAVEYIPTFNALQVSE